jgi:hypothetical protein
MTRVCTVEYALELKAAGLRLHRMGRA